MGKPVLSLFFHDLVRADGEPTRDGTVVVIVVYSIQTEVEVIA